MPNASYPDDDYTRDPGGVHGEGRKTGVSFYLYGEISRPNTLADMHANADTKNKMYTPEGECFVPNGRWAVDGDPSAGTAAYPPKPEDPNSQD